MKHLFKAFNCVEMDGKKLLLPGFPADPNFRLEPGSKIQLEIADGTLHQTTVLQTTPVFFNDSLILKLKLRVTPNTFYFAIHVPDDFDPPGIELGADVYLIDSRNS
jgi:hypothetical protein